MTKLPMILHNQIITEQCHLDDILQSPKEMIVVYSNSLNNSCRNCFLI